MPPSDSAASTAIFTIHAIAASPTATATRIVRLRAADRAYVIENGRVTLAGAARELIDDPAVQQAYLGV